MNIAIFRTVFLTLILLFSTISCNKSDDDNDGWSSCLNCNLNSWVGTFSGTASYYNAENNTTKEGLGVTIEIMETGTDYLTISINIPNYYSSTISGELTSGYAISFAGSSSSVTGTLYKKDAQLKLTGNAKRFHYKVDSLVIERVVSFETLKAVNE